MYLLFPWTEFSRQWHFLANLFMCRFEVEAENEEFNYFLRIWLRYVCNGNSVFCSTGVIPNTKCTSQGCPLLYCLFASFDSLIWTLCQVSPICPSLVYLLSIAHFSIVTVPTHISIGYCGEYLHRLFVIAYVKRQSAFYVFNPHACSYIISFVCILFSTSKPFYFFSSKFMSVFFCISPDRRPKKNTVMFKPDETRLSVFNKSSCNTVYIYTLFTCND